MGYFVILLVFCAMIFLIIAGTNEDKKQKKYKFLDKMGIDKEDVIKHEALLVLNGLDLPERTPCQVVLHKDYLYTISPNNTYKLSKDQICGAYHISEDEIRQSFQGKSTTGRAIIGGLALGPLGAILGATTGSNIKSKTTNVKKYILILSYKSSDSEMKTIAFAPISAEHPLALLKFLNAINDSYGLLTRIENQPENNVVSL